MRRVSGSAVGGLVLLLTVPVLTAWRTGDLTDEQTRSLAERGVRLDYAFEPLSFGPAGDRAVVVAACTTLAGSSGYLVWRTVTGRMRLRRWLVLLPLVPIGVIAGYSWRVWTSGQIGANIGAGLTVLFGGPVVLVLLLLAALARRWTDPRRAQRRRVTSG